MIMLNIQECNVDPREMMSRQKHTRTQNHICILYTSQATREKAKGYIYNLVSEQLDPFAF